MRRSALIRDETGAAMVEFAIVAPVLFAFIFGIIDFGRAMFLYNNLQDTARRGARLAAVQFPNPCNSEALIKDSVRSWVREFNNNPATAGQYTVTVACTMDAAGSAIPTTVSVQIANYPFRSIVPVPALQNLRMNQQAGVRFEGAPARF